MALNPSSPNPLPGYPSPIGNKWKVVDERVGPKSYVNGTGQKINASDYGLGGFDFAVPAGVSYSGTYFGRIFWPTSVAPSKLEGAQAYFYIKWYVLSSGNEVTNTTDLSCEILRLDLVGV